MRVEHGGASRGWLLRQDHELEGAALVLRVVCHELGMDGGIPERTLRSSTSGGSDGRRRSFVLRARGREDPAQRLASYAESRSTMRVTVLASCESSPLANLAAAKVKLAKNRV
jgi:hypothetical protein